MFVIANIVCTLNRIGKSARFRPPEMIPQYCITHRYCARFVRHYPTHILVCAHITSEISLKLNTPINVKPVGGETGHRVGFWHFQKNCCKIPYPRTKMWGQNNWNSSPREMICGHGHKQKFKNPYPRDSKIIQMPHPRAKAINQNLALCPAFPSPAGLTLIGA